MSSFGCYLSLMKQTRRKKTKDQDLLYVNIKSISFTYIVILWIQTWLINKRDVRLIVVLYLVFKLEFRSFHHDDYYLY